MEIEYGTAIPTPSGSFAASDPYDSVVIVVTDPSTSKFLLVKHKMGSELFIGGRVAKEDVSTSEPKNRHLAADNAALRILTKRLRMSPPIERVCQLGGRRAGACFVYVAYATLDPLPQTTLIKVVSDEELGRTNLPARHQNALKEVIAWSRRPWPAQH